MKLRLTLTEALHARPANLLVRLAATHEARVELRKGECRADAKNILEVLALGAAKGDSVELEASGQGADAAAQAIRELVERSFDADLVPERGEGHVDGIGIGRAVRIEAQGEAAVAEGDGDPGATPEGGKVQREKARLGAAVKKTLADVAALVAALGDKEAALFEPELAIVRALEPRLAELTDAGHAAEDAVRAATSGPSTDLLVDARTRLLEALAGGARPSPSIPEDAEVVVVAETLTPSLVALLPRNVVALVAAEEEGASAGFTSHASILARGRDLPLAVVPAYVAESITQDETVVVDTTSSPARIWVAPGEALLEDARKRREAHAKLRREREEKARAPLTHLRVAVRVNVGALREAVPPGAEGIGLLRTELLFAGYAAAPSEAEQVATTLAVARKASGGPVVARLFDAGGDKPLAWLPAPKDAPDARGIGLLRLHPDALVTQVRALCRAAESADLRILLPLVRSADDVHAVRALCLRAVPVGAMIETPAAAADIDRIATAADFVCIGTNDLAASLLGQDRAHASVSRAPEVLDLVRRVVEGAHAHGLTVTVCGELAADPEGAPILVGLGVDALSVAPARFAAVKLRLAAATREGCRQSAQQALAPLR